MLLVKENDILYSFENKNEKKRNADGEPKV